MLLRTTARLLRLQECRMLYLVNKYTQTGTQRNGRSEPAALREGACHTSSGSSSSTVTRGRHLPLVTPTAPGSRGGLASASTGAGTATAHFFRALYISVRVVFVFGRADADGGSSPVLDTSPPGARCGCAALLPRRANVYMQQLVGHNSEAGWYVRARAGSSRPSRTEACDAFEAHHSIRARLQRKSEFSLLRKLAKTVPAAFHEGLGVPEGVPYTFFAPIDSALQQLAKQLGNETVKQLVRNTSAFAELVRYHIVPGAAVLTTTLANDTRLGTALNASSVPPLLVAREPDGKVTIHANRSSGNLTDAPDIITCHGKLTVRQPRSLRIDSPSALFPQASCMPLTPCFYHLR